MIIVTRGHKKQTEVVKILAGNNTPGNFQQLISTQQKLHLVVKCSKNFSIKDKEAANYYKTGNQYAGIQKY